MVNKEGKKTDEEQKRKKSIDEVVKEWWKSEISDEPYQRAQIQRCGDLHTVVFTPAYQKLRRLFLAADIKVNDEYLALVAGVIGRLKKDSTMHPCEELATGGNNKRPLLHPLRFDRLVKARERTETYREMVAVLPLLDYTANISKLARDLYWWGAGLDSKVRKEWYTAYYEKVKLKNDND